MALFNEFRSRRPIEAQSGKIEVQDCKFCNPKENTPEDVFGRIEGKYCITASNMAKYDYLHGMIVFKDHEPFVYEKDKILDFLQVSLRWFKMAEKQDPEAKYRFFGWNCLWRAGASIVHGHAHVLLTKEPYAYLMRLRNACDKYSEMFGSDYILDMFEIHRDVGLGFRYKGAYVMCYITPVKDREIFIVSRNLNSLAESLSLSLRCYKRLGVESFNVGVFFESDYFEPNIALVVDRGDLSKATSDVGCMELLASTPVISTDPYLLYNELKKEY